MSKAIPKHKIVGEERRAAPEPSEVARRALKAVCAHHLVSGLVARDLLELMRCYRTGSRGSPCFELKLGKAMLK